MKRPLNHFNNTPHTSYQRQYKLEAWKTEQVFKLIQCKADKSANIEILIVFHTLHMVI